MKLHPAAELHVKRPSAARAADWDRIQSECEAFLAALSGIRDALKRLRSIADEKLGAMRAADTQKLAELPAQEAAVLRELSEHEAARGAALARLAQSLPTEIDSAVKLSDLATSMPEPFSSQILAKTAGLRAAARELEGSNRLVAAVAQALHRHLRGVLAEVASANQQTVVYGSTGRHEQRTTRSWVEAVG